MYLHKKILYPLFMLCLVLLASCNKDDDDNNVNPQPGVVGTWTLSSATVTFDGQSIRDFIEQLFLDMGIDPTEEQLNEAENDINEGLQGDFADGSTLEFRADGTYVARGADDTDEQGTWQLNNNILSMNDGSETYNLTVESLTDNSMRLSMEEEETLDPESNETVLINMTLSLNRQQTQM